MDDITTTDDELIVDEGTETVDMLGDDTDEDNGGFDEIVLEGDDELEGGDDEVVGEIDDEVVVGDMTEEVM
ncbi:hypothetical protein COY32_02620 [candidate division WWE3 bacterium CG_4_10_14_0_2_um_filter_41_14]|uniref:Uncharacterized protein n=1 Tax=candidate division WWE3 bacterium CG_4_10_14_0_2_um_filter_41_14 TaxID=1975072 RepID=A0A2M7TJR6_UNCKA|nr:MAG: hypothetical protein COY32_02620 [candidate division WWE3 bacterium CG_4_10_14_0_2_um_filter_41_14]